MKKIKVISIDFWDTLYFHTGTPDYRRAVRCRALRARLDTLGFSTQDTIADSFFETIDGYVKSSWSRNEVPSRQAVLRLAMERYEECVPLYVLDALLDEVYTTYRTTLCPELAPAGDRFLRWAHRRWPVYLISDTYTLTGAVLNRILEADGLLDLFRATLYSDELGCQKPDLTAMRKIIAAEGVEPAEVLHIGDRLDTDGELSRRAGCRCIIIRPERNHQTPIPATVFVGCCTNLAEAKELLSDLE